jgi:prophage regulatory protein
MSDEALLRLDDVKRRVGLSRAMIYRLQAQGFPRPVKLTAKSSAWVKSEIDAWIATKIDEGRQQRATQTN